jgi:hypothetical protein
MSPSLWNEHRDKIAGGWKCISFEVFDGAGKLIAKPYGNEPLGRVLISPNGYLSAQMADPARMKGPLPSGQTMHDGPDAEVAHVARGLRMYCGYMELLQDDKGELYWQTRVEVASDPRGIGGLEVRRLKYFEEDGKAYMILQPEKDLIMEVGSTKRLRYSRG